MLLRTDPDAPKTDDEAGDFVVENKIGLADWTPSPENDHRQSPLNRFEMLMQVHLKDVRRVRELALIAKRGRGVYCECLLDRDGDLLAAFFSAAEIMRSNGEVP
jgi:hypothetical protein